MNCKRTGLAFKRAKKRAVLCGAMLAGLAAATAYGQAANGDAGWRDVTVAEYAQHLQQLDGVVTGCQAQRAKKIAPPTANDACYAKQVGPDDRVSGAVPGDAKPREVRYDWLRAVLARADNKDGGRQTNLLAPLTGLKNQHPPPSVDTLLSEARTRLQADEQQAAAPATQTSTYAAEQQTLRGILAQRAYQNMQQVSVRERLVEWLDNVLDQALSSLVRFGMRSPWIIWVLRILLVAVIGVALAWLVFRVDRRSYGKLIPDVETAPNAPSAREWQLWLKDAQEMAAQGRWREAIHFVYWASIARLESRRLWPADRTRTPREYLGLMAGSDPRKDKLTALTRSFERTWYGGRDAVAADFNAALELAAGLGVGRE